jgi:hypothetical protein
MSHRAFVGIPFAFVVFVMVNMMGYARAGRFTLRNALIALAGATLWYLVGLAQ